MKHSYGKVFIVGAGPGSPDLLTLRGAECLRKADVVLYDRLAHPALLFHIPAHAKLIYCGKRPCAHTLRQEDIQREMYVHAKRGKMVVRLKGGDPGIFGRMAEELKELSNRNIPYEIVPGITAGSAAASYAGISLTHRGYAHGYQVLTGHGKNPEEDTSVDWFHLVETTDTLIWYMGMKRLPYIASQLIKYGKDPHEKVLISEWATHRHQRTVTGTLENIADKVKKADLKNPSIIIIGKVTEQHEELQWFQPSPVGGVLAFPQTKSEQQAFEQLKDQNAEVYISTLSKHSLENTLEIIQRLLEEKLIKHIVIPSTNEGTNLWEALSQQAEPVDLAFWRTTEKSFSSTTAPFVPVLSLKESPERWLTHLKAEEQTHEKATV